MKAVAYAMRWGSLALLGGGILGGAGCACLCGGAGGRTFSQDVTFLQRHTGAFVLAAGDGRIAVVPDYQGRVMTSTTGGSRDLSFGWLNYDLIRAGVQPPAAREGTLQAHIHVFGGEERFWLGPEGGQYAIFFKPGAAFTFDDWQTPAFLDTEPFAVESRVADRAVFTKDFDVVNHSGTRLQGSVRRTIRVLDAAAVAGALGAAIPPGVRTVAYETENVLRNRGAQAWEPATGLLSIWLLGMFKPGAETTIVIPFKPGPDAELGSRVNDTYFGKVPPERLVVKDDVLFFSGDGTYRSKIGIGPKRARGLAASYDAADGVLTVVTYNAQPVDRPYVNSMWEQQKEPYAGDVINAYNDGPPKPGAKPLGPFYELETSSPAAALKPGESIAHVQRTFHLQGDEAALDPVARALLGVGIAEIKTALKR